MKISELRYTVHPIDIKSTDKVQRQEIPQDADLDQFVRQLINSPLFEHENRKFHWQFPTALVPKLLSDMSRDNREFDDATLVLAERLREKERQAQDRVAQLKTEVQKGSLIQISFRRDDRPHILLVKVHLAPFLREADYKKQNGYPLENTVLKMSLIEFDENYHAVSVAVADSNARLAEYWWKGFLELSELTTDEFNTKTAFNSVEALLVRKLKKECRADYYQLRNNLIGYFRTNRHYNHTKMLGYVFGDYVPIAKQVNVEQLRAAANDLPKKDKFDSKFDIQSEFLDKRKRTIIPLTEQIDLELKDAIENMRDTIRSATMRDGTQGVFIRSLDGYEYFGGHQGSATVNLENRK